MLQQRCTHEYLLIWGGDAFILQPPERSAFCWRAGGCSIWEPGLGWTRGRCLSQLCCTVSSRCTPAHVLHRHVPPLAPPCLPTCLQPRELKLLFLVIHKKSPSLDGVVCAFIDLVPGTAEAFLSPACVISARALEQGLALAAAVSPVLLTLLV